MTHQAIANRWSLSSRLGFLCIAFYVFVTYGRKDGRTDTMRETNDLLCGRGLVGQYKRHQKQTSQRVANHRPWPRKDHAAASVEQKPKKKRKKKTFFPVTLQSLRSTTSSLGKKDLTVWFHHLEDSWGRSHHERRGVPVKMERPPPIFLLHHARPVQLGDADRRHPVLRGPTLRGSQDHALRLQLVLQVTFRCFSGVFYHVIHLTKEFKVTTRPHLTLSSVLF